MIRPAASAALVLVPTVLFLLNGCAVPPGMEGGTATVTDSFETLPPPGYGTLRQDEISLSLTSGTLRILVTPLEESATRVTAPDTYRRLSSLSNAHRNTPGMAESATLFLVSFFSEQPDQRFVPEEVQQPVDDQQVHLGQRVTEMAVYAFNDNVDLKSDLVVAYGLEQTAAWSAILRRIQAERARARARVGGHGGA